jgi:hypothetical protein
VLTSALSSSFFAGIKNHTVSRRTGPHGSTACEPLQLSTRCSSGGVPPAGDEDDDAPSFDGEAVPEPSWP